MHPQPRMNLWWFWRPNYFRLWPFDVRCCESQTRSFDGCRIAVLNFATVLEVEL